ncbi:MAG: hypothetical protein QOF14_3742 [Hyphomicrobiales bacterium]|jgi:hypothetical protein|nr:hypothetical protein [Hyphomicrobiales bacterium]
MPRFAKHCYAYESYFKLAGEQWAEQASRLEEVLGV